MLLVSYIQNNRSYNSRQALKRVNMQIHEFMLCKIPQTWKYLHLSTSFSNLPSGFFLLIGTHFLSSYCRIAVRKSATTVRLLCLITALRHCPLHFSRILACFLHGSRVVSFSGRTTHQGMCGGICIVICQIERYP